MSYHLEHRIPRKFRIFRHVPLMVLMAISFSLVPVASPLSKPVLAQSATPTPIVMQPLPLAPIPPEPTIIVNLLDDGSSNCPTDCTLRGAIEQARSGDVIGFAPELTGRIRLNETLTIDKDLTIVGPGADKLALDGGGRVTVLTVPMNEPYTIRHEVIIFGLTIQNGTGTVPEDSYGGGILNSGDLTLVSCIIRGNSADHGGGIAVYVYGKLTLFGTEVRDNSASQNGGGIFSRSSEVMIVGSTISNNSSPLYTGGIESQQSYMTLINTTISGNLGGRIGGISSIPGYMTLISVTISQNLSTGPQVDSSAPVPNVDGIAVIGSILTVGSTIITHNQRSDNFGSHVDIWIGRQGDLNSLGYNLFGTAVGLDNVISSDRLDIDQSLISLADNGGPTQTMALDVGSPAIGGGNCNLLFTVVSDQRGVPRKDPCDIGAFESEFNTN